MTLSDVRHSTRRTSVSGIGSWVVGVLLAGCGPPPVDHAQPTVLALAQSVLGALERRDAVALLALALSEQEFRHHVWPELPASRPERNLPFSYVWGELRQKSEQSLARLLSTYGAQQLDLVDVEYAGATTRYSSYAVHRETVLVVRDRTGTEHRLRLFGSTLEADGAFKVFSFVVDE
jgi:hypothetical protein